MVNLGGNLPRQTTLHRRRLPAHIMKKTRRSLSYSTQRFRRRLVARGTHCFWPDFGSNLMHLIPHRSNTPSHFNPSTSGSHPESALSSHGHCMFVITTMYRFFVRPLLWYHTRSQATGLFIGGTAPNGDEISDLYGDGHASSTNHPCWRF